MAKEIVSIEDAKGILVEYWPKIAERADQYAQFAWNLTDMKTFETLAEALSKELWIEYNTFPPDTSNRFTKTLMLYGAKNHGFSFEMQYVLTGNATSFFNQIVKGKHFWKDAINKRHGEYTHSLQWLAAGMKLGTNLSDLYANSPIPSVKEMKGRSPEKTTVTATQYLWTWLVDCRPNAKDPDNPEGKGIFSDTYRTQEIATTYFNKMPESFLGYVLNARMISESRGFGNMSDEEFNKYAIARHSNDLGWEPVTQKKAPDAVVGFQRRLGDGPAHTTRGGQPLKPKKDAIVEKMFHGIPGTIAMR